MSDILSKSEQLQRLIDARNKKVRAILKINEEISILNLEISANIAAEFTIDQALEPKDVIEAAPIVKDTVEPKVATAPWNSAANFPVLEWREQRKKRNNAVIVQPTKNICSPHHIRRTIPATAAEQSIQITDQLSLPAINVATFDDVLADGRLFYVSTVNHFAMYIGRTLFHGNIGTIYTNEKQPSKIKNCQHHNADYAPKQNKCTFYHDPMLFNQSTDIRNFVANSWLYSARTTDDPTTNKYRKFGSLQHLDEDIKFVNSDDINKYRDMVFHDLLCVLILLGKD